ncbi:MAG: TolC family protein [Longimicrobiales bacterium]|nr:TolC family protein [Longimicrobiales bacterium]
MTPRTRVGRVLAAGALVLAGGLAPLEAQERPGAAAAGDTMVVGLPDVERIALENSPLMEVAYAQVDVSRARETAARGLRFLPELNLRNVWGPVPQARGEFTETGVLISPDTMTGIDDLTWFTQVDLTLVQPLFTFGKIGSRIDAAGHGVRAAQAGLDRTRADLLNQVRELYWGAVLTDELVRVARSLQDRVDEAETRLEELYDEGSATQNDMFKFELFRYEVSSQMREVDASRSRAFSGLKALLGLPDDTPVRLADQELYAMEVELDSLPDYIRSGLARRPELRQLEAGIAAREALVRAAAADGKPSFFLAGRYSFNESPGRFDPRNPFVNNPTNFSRPSILLGMEWNLNFRQTGDQARMERRETEALAAQVGPLRRLVEQEVREAYLDVVRARDDVEDGRTALRASENLLRAELQTFDIGIGNIEDVIDAFKSNVEMTVTQFRNLARFNTKVAELNRRAGRTSLQNGIEP